MNEVKLLNIGGIDQNIKDQYARDVIAPSENGLDSSTNLPVSSRHYDEGAYLIGQDRQYYIAITEIDVGDPLVVGTNVRATTVSDEIIALKNQSADTVLEVIADMETSTTASKGYSVGSYLYWNYGLSAGMYKVIAEIDTSDALVVDTNIEAADKIMNIISGIESKLDTIKYSNPNLLDNPWFTVNQRGNGAISSKDGYITDRWTYLNGPTSGGTSVTSENGVRFYGQTNNRFFIQKFPANEIALLVGKTLTATVLLSDGTIYKGTNVLKDSGQTTYISNSSIYVYSIASNNELFGIGVKAGVDITIRAVKLEFGSVSTLANDVAPNYAEELAKCQRYFVRYKSTLDWTTFASGYELITDGGTVKRFIGMLNTPCALRIRPSCVFSGTIYANHDKTQANGSITSIVIDTITGNSLKIDAIHNSLSGGVTAASGDNMLMYLQNGAYIDLSADL